MSYLKYISLCLILTGLSCTTVKWKYRYMERRYQALKKYNADSAVILTVPDDIQSLTKLKRLRKAKFIAILDKLERNVALYPDSTVVISGKTDSFYFNKNKIAYIRQHGLQSSRIQFLPAN